MKIAAILLATCFVCIYASDVKLMEIFNGYIEAAERNEFDEADKNIPEVAGELGLNGLVYLVKEAGLNGTLSGQGPFTVFGPTDKAFYKLPKFLLIKLVLDKELLTKLLTYHVVAGNVSSSELSNDLLVKSVEGNDIRINIYGEDDKQVITASGRVVSKPDQYADNGVIHVVDDVLFPPFGTFVDIVSNSSHFSTLLTAVQAAEEIVAKVLSSPGNLTLFAPTDHAFEKIPEKCLKALLADKEKLTTVNIWQGFSYSGNGYKDAGENRPIFSLITMQAVRCTNRILRVLTYHVVPSTQYSAGLKCGEKLKTVEGSELSIRKFCRLYVDHARVIARDITVTNGVFHAIDKVLFPGDLMAEMCPESQELEDDFEHPAEEFPFLF